MTYECDRQGSTYFDGKRIRYVKGKNVTQPGALGHVKSCRMVSEANTAVVSDAPNRETIQPDNNYPMHTHAGWYELSNGEKVRGKAKAIKAQKELE